ncbi:MAG TPA: lyase [Burkholderiaceae bacterium]|nr:lyase [Burkholderiaceae bacterium]
MRRIPEFGIVWFLRARVLAVPLFVCVWFAPIWPVHAQAQYFDVPPGSGAHDVAPAQVAGGPVYFTEQRGGRLGVLTPADGKVEQIDLGQGSAPHGVIIGPDGAPWITDGGLNAIVRVDPKTKQVRRWPLPSEATGANLNTAAFDSAGQLWFTGQSGWYGRFDPVTEQVRVWKAPRGFGPYGITCTSAGQIYYASLAGNYIARIDTATGAATVIDPPTAHQGARRLATDTHGRIWVSYWNTGQVARYDPSDGAWREWKLPGAAAHAYAIWVDELDHVWLSEWSANALVRFDPVSETFASFVSSRDRAAVRQLAGRPGEVWGAESGNDRLVMEPTH